MISPDKEFERELARLSAEFVERLPVQVKSVGDDLAAWLSMPREAELYERLSHKVHQLKGAGSTFGCPEISDAARALEHKLAELRVASRGDVAPAPPDVETAMRQLQNEAARLHAAVMQ
jgi:chemotaxis protein histidine kinase CheA